MGVGVVSTWGSREALGASETVGWRGGGEVGAGVIAESTAVEEVKNRRGIR